MSVFTSERVSAHVIRILTPCGVCMYLVEGSERAALLDTGFGFGDLKGYVERLTGKPYVVLLSHGHLDHAGGSIQFEEVYLNRRDWPLERWHNTLERRLYDVHNGPGGMPEGVSDGDFLPQRTAPYRDIDEGDDFDLGGVTVRPIAVPGHSKGSLIFLVPEDRIAVFGDACGEHTLLLFADCAPIETYRRSLIHAAEFDADFDVVLRNHGSYCSPKAILADNIELCSDILARRDAAVPVNFFGESGLLGRPEQHPGKVGNIVYHPDRLREI